MNTEEQATCNTDNTGETRGTAEMQALPRDKVRDYSIKARRFRSEDNRQLYIDVVIFLN